VKCGLQLAKTGFVRRTTSVRDTEFVFAIAAEDDMCFVNATVVANVIAAEHQQGIPFAHTWVGHPRGASYLRLSRLNEYTKSTWGSGSKKFHGRRDGQDIRVKKVVALFEDLQPDLIIIALDIDRENDRNQALRNSLPRQLRVVLALMNPEAEAWRIALFTSDTVYATQRHTVIRRTLMFDPVQQPHRLSSTAAGAGLRDVKACHDQLFASDDESLSVLTTTSAHFSATPVSTGLPQFAQEFELMLKELIGTELGQGNKPDSTDSESESN
jgi:hypothetical protein